MSFTKDIDVIFVQQFELNNEIYQEWMCEKHHKVIRFRQKKGYCKPFNIDHRNHKPIRPGAGGEVK